MNELGTKFKRQIEILGTALHNVVGLGTDDLARMYGVERLTIKRDLQDLRRHGIDIHSERRKGVKVTGKLDQSRVQRIVSSYLALSNVGRGIEKASSLLAKKHGEGALPLIVRLQRCIEDRKVLELTYESEHRHEHVAFELQPVQIFQAGGLWRLLAVHDKIIKQFLLTKIITVAPTDETFREVDQDEIEKVYQHSFLSWTGTEQHRVLLKVSPKWARGLRARSLIGFDLVSQQSTGEQLLEGTVNSLEEIARWVVSQGGAVEVVSPKALHTKVVSLASQCLEKHR